VVTVLNCLKGVATLVQCRFFSERVVNAWNSLPRDTNFNSVAKQRQIITASVTYQPVLCMLQEASKPNGLLFLFCEVSSEAKSFEVKI